MIVQRKKQRGFTLIELLVVVGILVVISSIVLTNNAKFGGQILLRNLAYDIALSVREAQVYGISARRFNNAEFAAGHGIYFDLLTSNNSFSLYTDFSQDGFFTPGSFDEIVKSTSLGKRYVIDRLCRPTSLTTEICDVEKIDILFKRPEPDAIIRIDVGSGFSQYDRARIVIVSPQGNKLSVLIETTGQISVQRYAQ